MANEIINFSTGTITVEDCFWEPEVWTEESKQAYTAWLARMSDSHPSKKRPEPWLLDSGKR